MDALFLTISGLIQSVSNGNDWIQIAVVIFILLLAWGILRFFLKLAFKVFAAGCFLILVLGLIFIAMRLF